MFFKHPFSPWVSDLVTRFLYDIQYAGYFVCLSRCFADAWLEANVFVAEDEYDPAWVGEKITPVLSQKLEEQGFPYAFGGIPDHPQLTW